MKKYTQGSWIAVGGLVEVEDDNIPDVCSCYPADFGQVLLSRSEEEIAANAKLIAQAPNMAVVIKELLEVFCDDPRWDDVAIVGDAKKVLYNATGEKL